MAKNNKKSRFRRPKVDRISHLPCHIIDHILQLLPLKDAVRTSLLSTHWRYKWAMLPNLVLDRPFFSDALKYNCACKEELESDSDDEDVRSCCHHKISRYLFARSELVTNMLLHHVGPIYKFSLHIPHWFPRRVDFSHWIQFVSGKSVKEFALSQEQDTWTMFFQKRKMPSSMFSPVGFNDLTHLTFTNISFPSSFPSTFKGFPCLISLKVVMDRGTPSAGLTNKLEFLVSKCPQLESFHSSICDKHSCLTIRAPKLQNLVLDGALSSICLEETKKIKKLVLDIELDLKRDTIMELFSSLPLLEELNLSRDILKANWLREADLLNACIEFKQLKCLVLDLKFESLFVSSFLLCLFKIASNLEKLEFYFYVSDGFQSFPGNITAEDCCLNHLKSATVRCFLYRSVDSIALQLMKLILSSSPVLEVMTICAIVESKELDIDQLLLYHGASSSAEIIFKPKEDEGWFYY